MDLLQGTATAEGTDTLTSIEGVFGSRFADTLRGNDAANMLFGGAGNDNLQGLGGDDYLLPDLGDDVVDGGEGAFDVVDFFFSPTGVNASLTMSASSGEGTDTIAGVEGVFGSNFDDILEGSAARDIVVGGIGDDLLRGQAGNDDLDGGPDTDFADGGPGTDSCKDNEDGTSCEDQASPPTQPLLSKARSIGRVAKRSNKRSN